MSKDSLRKLKKRYDLNVNSLSNRIILQKTVYILSKMKYPNINSYKYSFYIYGPYSTDVASDAYSLAKEKDNNSIAFSDEELQILSKFDEMINNVSSNVKDMPKHTQLELLADIIHFNRDESIKNKNKLFNRLTLKHSYFNNETAFSIACDTLVANDLISLE